MLHSKYGNEIKGNPDKKFWWNRINMHFISKYLTGCVIISIIVKSYINNKKYSTLFNFVSIGSITCFFMQIPIILLLKGWCNGDDVSKFYKWNSNIRLKNDLDDIECQIEL